MLESHRKRLGVSALVLATPAGDLVAGAGHRQADVAAAVVEDAPTIATWRMRAGDRDLVLASLGGRLDHATGEAIRRIAG